MFTLKTQAHIRITIKEDEMRKQLFEVGRLQATITGASVRLFETLPNMPKWGIRVNKTRREHTNYDKKLYIYLSEQQNLPGWGIAIALA